MLSLGNTLFSMSTTAHQVSSCLKTKQTPMERVGVQTLVLTAKWNEKNVSWGPRGKEGWRAGKKKHGDNKRLCVYKSYPTSSWSAGSGSRGQMSQNERRCNQIPFLIELWEQPWCDTGVLAWRDWEPLRFWPWGLPSPPTVTDTTTHAPSAFPAINLHLGLLVGW